MTDRKPTFERGINGYEHVRVGPLLLFARDKSAGIYSVMIKPGIDSEVPAPSKPEARRLAIDEARKIVAEWSSELDRLAEECR